MRDQRMRMVGRGDGDRIDIVSLEQLAVIGERFDLATEPLFGFLSAFVQNLRIDVAERDNVLAQGRNVAASLAAGADHRHANVRPVNVGSRLIRPDPWS